MSILTDLFAGGASTLVDSIGNVISKVHTTTGEKMTIDSEIQKAAFSHDETMANINLEIDKAELADTDSARKMNESIENSATASWLSKNIVPLMAIFFTVLCFCFFFIILAGLLHFGPFGKGQKFEIDADSKNILIYLMGSLSTIVITIVTFYFGSSHGSNQKNDIIERLGNK